MTRVEALQGGRAPVLGYDVRSALVDVEGPPNLDRAPLVDQAVFWSQEHADYGEHRYLNPA